MLGGIRSVEVSSAEVRPDFGFVIGSWAQALILLTVALLSAPGCGYDIIVDYHDAERAHQGVTFVTNFDQQRLTAIDMDGTVVWDLEVRDSQWLPGQANGFRVQGDGTICYLLGGGPILANLSPFELLFEGTYLEGHHSIMMTPHDTFMVVAADVFVLNEPPFDKFPCVRGDKLLEVDLDGNIVWESDYLPFRNIQIPEISDLNVLPSFRRRGIATAIMDKSERMISEHSDTVGIGFDRWLIRVSYAEVLLVEVDDRVCNGFIPGIENVVAIFVVKDPPADRRAT